MNTLRTLALGLVVSFLTALLLVPATTAAQAAPATPVAPASNATTAPQPLAKGAVPAKQVAPAAKARRYWGAISISADHRFAYALDKGSKQKAKDSSFYRCRHTSDFPETCIKATWFYNYCAAIVYKDNANGYIKKYKVAFGYTRAIAIKKAHRKLNGDKLLGYACTTRYRR